MFENNEGKGLLHCHSTFEQPVELINAGGRMCFKRRFSVVVPSHVLGF